MRNQTLPKFIPHEVTVQLEPAPEVPLSLWQRARARAWCEVLAWKTELTDWSKEKEWLNEFWENRRREWEWFARGTNLAWGFLAIALWERISRADMEDLKRETNLAGKTPPNTFALIIGAGVTLWAITRIGVWTWPYDLLGIAFIVLQVARLLIYLGSPMHEPEIVTPQNMRQHRSRKDGALDREWERED